MSSVKIVSVMEHCKYDKVLPNGNNCEEKQQFSWRPLLRQLHVSIGAMSIYFVLGLCFGAPTVFIPQLRKEANETNPLTEDMVSWLTSVQGYSSLPWVIILPIVSQMIGRKIPFLVVTVLTTVSALLFYCSTSPFQLLISEILQGVTLASNMTILIVIVTEYSSRRYRGVFMILESTMFYWGMWIANLTGAFSHWKNIAIIQLFCCAYSLTLVVVPESPSWLAMRGRFEECAVAHHWLKGFDEESEEELENLIKSQKEYIRREADRKFKTSSKMEIIKETVTTRGFYQPLLLAITMLAQLHFSGKLVCSMYAVDLISQITDNEAAAYTGMIILDGVTILGMLFGCLMCKFLNRRTLLMWSSVIGIIFLYVLSFYLYLASIKVIDENKIVSIVLLTLFSVSITCGPMLMPCVIFSELIFLRYKSLSLLIVTLFTETLMATVLKLSPLMFKAFTLPGSFLFFGVCSSILTLILFKYLPETKDKTLQEIENYFIKSCDLDRKIIVDVNTPLNTS